MDFSNPRGHDGSMPKNCTNTYAARPSLAVAAPNQSYEPCLIFLSSQKPSDWHGPLYVKALQVGHITSIAARTYVRSIRERTCTPEVQYTLTLPVLSTIPSPSISGRGIPSSFSGDLGLLLDKHQHHFLLFFYYFCFKRAPYNLAHVFCIMPR